MRPEELLESSLNQRVSLLLKDSSILEGRLVGVDDYMNMVLEDVEEKRDGEKRRLDRIVLRGNNIVSIGFV